VRARGRREVDDRLTFEEVKDGRFRLGDEEDAAWV
jgi:hypothetical protein